MATAAIAAIAPAIGPAGTPPPGSASPRATIAPSGVVDAVGEEVADDSEVDGVGSEDGLTERCEVGVAGLEADDPGAAAFVAVGLFSGEEPAAVTLITPAIPTPPGSPWNVQ